MDFLSGIGIWFTGIGPLLWKFLASGGVVGLLLLFAKFSPFFKKTALYLAGAIVYGMITYSVGVWDEHGRVTKQANARVEREVQIALRTRVQAEAETAVPDGDRGFVDRWLRGKQGADCYDRDQCK